MNVDWINPFLNSMTNVLSTMANISATPQKPILKQDSISLGVLSGYIELQGEQTEGSLAISFDEPIILAITNNMLGENLTQVDETAKDMVGELTNMVCGGAKNILSDRGFNFELATPQVIKGAPHDITHLVKGGPVILLPFKAKEGEFFIEVCFKE